MDGQSRWISGVIQQVVASAIIAVCAVIFGWVGFVLAKATTPLQSYEPFSYYLAGLTAAILGGLCVLVANSVWRRFYPLVGDQHIADGLPFDDSDLRRDMNGIEVRLTGALDGIKEVIAVQRETDGANVAVLADRIHSLGDLHNNNLDYARCQISSLYDALNAIYQHERLAELSKLIEAGATELRGPTDQGEDLNNTWDEWETKLRAWRSVLEEWCAVANCYSNGVSDRVLMVSEDELHQDGKANLCQFPTIAALMTYRAFNIRYFKWRNWQEEVRKAVLKIAIEGSAQSRPIYFGTTYVGDRDENSKGATLRRIAEGNDQGRRP